MQPQTKLFPTGNSHTLLPFADDWIVLDVGSGHQPHPRANVLAERFILDDTERSGQKIVMLTGKWLVQADGAALPFPTNAFDFVICSHVLEHIPAESLSSFCSELARVAKAGYIETPSKWAEMLRHAPNHRWFITARGNKLLFEPTPDGYPLRWFGKLFFSFYFYDNIQAKHRDVFRFALGVPKPWHFIFLAIRKTLVKFWLLAKPVTYTRLHWQGGFDCDIKKTP